MNMSSTTNIIHIYLQNVQKNYVLVNSLLESQKDLYDILFNLHLLLQALVARRSLVLLFIQNGPRWSDFHRTLSRHPELCVLFILDCPGFALLSGET